MRSLAMVGMVLGVLTCATAAAAQEPDGSEPDVVRKPANDVSLGYQVEAGAATTRVSRGYPRLATKTTPVTEDLAAVRAQGVGGGSLTAGTSTVVALADPAIQPTNAPEFAPFALYRVRAAVADLAMGFDVKLYPRKDVVDGAYEGILRLAVPNAILTPVVEAYPEVVRKRGAYAAVGAEHDFVAGRLSVKPRVTTGAQGFAEGGERPHANDVTAAVQVRATLDSGFYIQAKPGYAVLITPDHYVKDASFGGRSVAFAALAVGVER